MAKVKFAGTFLVENIENNKRLFYSWNENRPCKVISSTGNCLALYMRVKIDDRVYFVSDSETIDQFLNGIWLLNSSFFTKWDYDMTDVSESTLQKYFEFIA